MSSSIFSLKHRVFSLTTVFRWLSNIQFRQHQIHNTASYTRRNFSTNFSQYETLNVSQPTEYVWHVELNRPEKANALSDSLIREMTDCFNCLNSEKACRSVVLSGAGKHFTSGIDIGVLVQGLENEETDPARKATSLRHIIKEIQDAASCLERCGKPVIAVIHSACIGLGVDIISAADIRYSSKDAYFQIKEVEMGLAADVGTLQRFPKIVGNSSITRELVYTSRKFNAEEAKHIGFLSAVLDDKYACLQKGLDTAKSIAEKSPVAVQTSKYSLIYSRDHTVEEGLQHITNLNQVMLQSEDCIRAITASVQKEKPTFEPL